MFNVRILLERDGDGTSSIITSSNVSRKTVSVANTWGAGGVERGCTGSLCKSSQDFLIKLFNCLYLKKDVLSYRLIWTRFP